MDVAPGPSSTGDTQPDTQIPNTSKAGPQNQAEESLTYKTIRAVLQDVGVTQYDERCVPMLADFCYRYVAQCVEYARASAELAGPANAGPQDITDSDIRLAVAHWCDAHVAGAPPPAALQQQLAAELNAQPLPKIRQGYGLMLPPDRYCLMQTEYKLKDTTRLGGPGHRAGATSTAGRPQLSEPPVKRERLNM